MRNSWVQAAIILGNNPEEKVLCPICENQLIHVEDIGFDDEYENFERKFGCKSCGQYNYLRMRKEGAVRKK
jgi:hypothetical protein